MISLKVSNCDDKNTFEYFYKSLIDKLTKYPNESNKYYTFQFMKIIIIAIVATCVVNLLVFQWSYFVYYHYIKIYEIYHLYYIRDWLEYVILWFISSSLIVHLFMNGYYNYSLKYNIMVSFIVCIMIHGAIITLLVWQYHQNNTYSQYFKFFCDKILTHEQTFQFYCESYFSIFGIYLHILGFPLCLFVIILFNHCLSIFAITQTQSIEINDIHSNRKAANRQTVGDEYDNTQKSIVEIGDLNRSLISSSDDSYKNDNYNNDNNTTKIQKQCNYSTYNDESKSVNFCLYNVFAITLFLLFGVFKFFGTMLYYYSYANFNINEYYYGLIFTISLFKLILKFIARKIDIINVNRHRARDQHNHITDIVDNWHCYVSMEMFVEFFMNFVYFTYYYQMFIYELSQSYICGALYIIFSHIFSELCQSVIRFSKIYFNITQNICSNIKNHDNYSNNNNMFGKASSLLLYVFEDDSTLVEWRTRHSIDVSMRAIAFVIAFVWFGFDLISIPYKYWLISNKSDYYNGVFYLFLSFSCDLVYFIFLTFFNHCCNEFNVWKPLTLIYISNHRIVVCLCLLSFSLGLMTF